MKNQYVRQGDSLRRAATARQWNDFIRATNSELFNSSIPTQVKSFDSSERNNLTTLLTNGATQLEDRSIAGLGEPSILPSESDGVFEKRLSFKGIAPVRGRFGVTTSAIEPEVIGQASIGGAFSCKLQVDINGEWIDRADVDIANPTRLRAVPNGSAQILWKETGTGVVDAIVRLGNPQHVHLTGTAVDDIPGGSTGNVNVWLNGSTQTNYIIGTGVGNTLNEPVYLDWMHQGLQVSAGKQVIIGWFPHESRWRITHAECEDNPPTLGQLANGPDPQPTQALTTTPAFINAFDDASQTTFSTPNVTTDAATARITLPDIPNTEVYRTTISGQFVSGSNNNEYVIEIFVNGAPTTPPSLIKINARQANQSTPYSLNLLVPVVAQSAPQFDLRMYTSAGTDTITWESCIFALEKNLDL